MFENDRKFISILTDQTQDDKLEWERISDEFGRYHYEGRLKDDSRIVVKPNEANKFLWTVELLVSVKSERQPSYEIIKSIDIEIKPSYDSKLLQYQTDFIELVRESHQKLKEDRKEKERSLCYGKFLQWIKKNER